MVVLLVGQIPLSDDQESLLSAIVEDAAENTGEDAASSQSTTSAGTQQAQAENQDCDTLTGSTTRARGSARSHRSVPYESYESYLLFLVFFFYEIVHSCC